MSETVFRTTQSTQTPQAPVAVSKNDPATVKSDTVDVPYMDYEAEHGRPYLADHFSLGDRWSDPEGGFPREVMTIQGYISEKIKTGEIANSQSAVNELLRTMEKTNNLTREERTVVKLEVLSHYIEFLQKNDTTRRNLRRYSSY